MLDADPSIVRIVWALLVFLTGGIALLVYIVMAIVVPERPEGMPVHASTAAGAPGPSWAAPGAAGVDAGAPSAAAGTSGGDAGTPDGVAGTVSGDTGTPRAAEPVPEGGWRAPDGSTVPIAAAAPTTGAASPRPGGPDARRPHRRPRADPPRWLLPDPPVRAVDRSQSLVADRGHRRRGPARGPGVATAAPFELTDLSRTMGWWTTISDPWIAALAGPASSVGLSCSVRGPRRLPVARAGGRHVDLDDQLDRGRRGPHQRRHRAGRADPGLAPPERPVRLLPGHRSATAATPRSRTAATPRSARSGSGSATPPGSLRVFPRGARIDAPLRFEDETGTVGDEPAGLAMRIGRPRPGRPRSTARPPSPSCCASASPADDAPAGLAPATGAGAGASTARRGSSRAIAVTIVGRAAPVLATWSIRPARTSGTGPAASLDRPGGRRRPRRGPCGRHPRRRPGGRLGQRRDPGLRDRPAGGRRPSSTRPPTRCRSPTPTRPPASSARFEIAPEIARPRGLGRRPAARSPTATPARRRGRDQDRFVVGLARRRRWRSPRRWSWPSAFSGGFGA